MSSVRKRIIGVVIAALMLIVCPIAVFATEGGQAGDVAVNSATEVTYGNVSDALNEAEEGETIVLLKDAETKRVSVTDNVILDLNGHALEASYVTCFGNIVDKSENTAGVLKVNADRFFIQNGNAQLPVKGADGYQFCDVIKFNTKYQDDLTRFVFQPFVDVDGHESIKAGAELSGVSVKVKVSWMQGDGKRTQKFVYNDSMVSQFLESYGANDKYGKMFSLILSGIENIEELTFEAVVVSDTGVEFASEPVVIENKIKDDNTGSGDGEQGEGPLDPGTPDNPNEPGDEDIENKPDNPGDNTGGEGNEGDNTDDPTVEFPDEEDGKISGDVSVDENNFVTEDVELKKLGKSISATIPAGVKLEEGTTKLVLTIKAKNDSDSDVETEEDEVLKPFDVHIEGIAADNTKPIIINMGEIMPVGLNIGNYTFYHVEGDVTKEMTAVSSVDELNAHNQFYYDPATGNVTVCMATFSEITVVANEVNPWNGTYDYSWYTSASKARAEANEYIIANADQLAAFGAIVGGMDGQTQDSFTGKTVKLISDVNLGDKESENNPDLIFYPIGYYNNTEDGTYKKTSGGSVTSSVHSFEGTFDGNGHTVANFYQNTWEMFGGYNDGYSGTPNHYKDAMGLFGYVVNGTVKNLTVDNFSSDGEFTPTGVVAAYAVNSTFENIEITNCNPRVYNTGNGGIVGIGGNSDDPDTCKLTFNNITIDNSNKITALWGSWDVACGGLVGMFRGAGHAHMNNCHVAAQIDVYNDVCGNYQYYWYRYSGMMIGTNKNMITDDQGYTVPETEKFHAKDCTVHFGKWNDYYYCELVANSLASYTHDHQFSRLEQIKSLEEIKSGDEWTKAGNFLSINGDSKTCYHIVNKDGVLTQHKHEDAGKETVNGETVLKENNQIVYLPFNQLFTGYGWGVKHIPVYNGEDYAFDGITILDRDVANSVAKFEKADNAKDSYTTESTVAIGELFKAANIDDEKLQIKGDKVQVTVSPVGEGSTAGATYTADTTDWTQGTLTFSGIGAATITINDYYFCTPTTINVTIEDKESVEKFETKFTGDFLYRVGNQNAVKLDSLFKAKYGATIGNVSVTVETIQGASGTYTSNATWTNGTIQFEGTGVVKVTIKDDDTYCKPTELILEVVDAINATGATSATANNVVLLNDCGLGSLTVSGRYTFYGNGFTATYTGNGQYLNNGLKQGVVTVSENGTLDNLRIKASIYPKAYLYYGSTMLGDYVQGGPSSVEGDRTRYHYQLSAVAASGNATISNCYIYGGRNNIFVNTGDVTIEDTVLECGTVANIQIQSNASHTITLNNVTTIQHKVNPTNGTESDKENVMLGTGVLVGPETTENPKIVLNGDFKQYNWVTADDANVVSDTKVTKTIIQSALDATAYNHNVNGKIASNLGIIYMNEFNASITNNTGLPYVLGEIAITPEGFGGNSATGQVYSVKNAGNNQIYFDYESANRESVNGFYEPQFKYPADLGGQYIEKTDDGDEHCYRDGDTIHVMFPSGDTKELGLAALVNIAKYSGQDLDLTITCKDENGNAVAVKDGKVSLSNAGEYTVTYTVTDTLFYDKAGKIVKKEVNYSWDVAVSISLKDTAIPDARFEFDTTKQKMGYYKPSWGDVKQYLPFLAGLKIYDYNGKTEYLRFDGSSDFNKVASITITGYESNKALVEIKLTDGGVINTRFLARANSGGGSTYTGKIKTSNNTIYFVTDSGTSNKDTTTTAAYWYVDYYKFTGNNGVAVQSAQQTFNSTGSSASTPSGNFSTTIKYTVTYDVNEGNCGQTVGYATSASTAVTLPTPTRSGYMFVGWFTAASGGTRVGGAGESYTPSANITLYAQWGKPCTVTYDANGGSCGTASEKYTGTALTLPTPTRDGYWFTGWYDAEGDGNKIGNAGTSYQATGDITLYAQWSPVYTVTYDANGGSCGIASEKYTGTALTLPMPTRDGYAFNGWYTAASGGTKVEGPYTPKANITLYAQWKDPITVTYDVTTNGGSCGTTSQTYLGTALTLPKPADRTGYTFSGWYTAASGGTKVGDAGATYTPSANITLYAQWQKTEYIITVTTTNATVSGVTNGQKAYYGDTITFTVTYSGDNSKTTIVKDANGKTVSTTGNYTFTMPASDVTIEASSTEASSTCIATGTLITLADGSQAKVEDLTGEEELLVWNLETGEYDTASIVFVDSDPESEYEIVHLFFEDGTEVEVIYEHGFFDVDEGKYVYLDAFNAADYIGHTFVKQAAIDNNTWDEVKLTDVKIETKKTTAYSPVTFSHLCYYVEGMLSMPGGIEGLFNIFDIDTEVMVYDKAKMEADIEKYGLFTFEDFEGMIPEEAYEAFNGKYLKVAIEKGLIDWETIESLAERYVPLM